MKRFSRLTPTYAPPRFLFLTSSSETVVPIGPVGREAFRSAAEGSAFGFTSREMSLWSPDRNLKPQQPISKKRVKAPAGPEHERSECEGGFGLRCRVPLSAGRRVPSRRRRRGGGRFPAVAGPIKVGGSRVPYRGCRCSGKRGRKDTLPSRPIAVQSAPCCQRDRGVDFRRGPLGPEGSAGPVGRTWCKRVRGRRPQRVIRSPHHNILRLPMPRGPRGRRTRQLRVRPAGPPTKHR
jgi:hypothetical protein